MCNVGSGAANPLSHPATHSEVSTDIGFEVGEPILNSAFAEPKEHWYIQEGELPKRLSGRRPAMVFQPEAEKGAWPTEDGILHPLEGYHSAYELALVNLIRERVKEWRNAGYPGATRTTLELLEWWRRDGRNQRLFFAQVEAAEAIIFLTEARADFLQGVNVPPDEPGESDHSEGYTGFKRFGCKMATGAGKTTVMGMLAAWSILNKTNARADARFSDVVLVVCPNVTIRDRLREISPETGEASLYRTRDLVPPHLMPLLSQGKVVVTNWHVFEPQSMQTGGTASKVIRAGKPVRARETIHIAARTTTGRGKRYMTVEAFTARVAAGEMEVLEEVRDAEGNLSQVIVVTTRYLESDTALIRRVLGREIGGKQNILVMNDEAHHAYRIRREVDDDEGEDDSSVEDIFGEDEEAEEFYREATVWVDGLDRIGKQRGINFCIDLSATPYYLGRIGQDTAKPFPWVVSDFGLMDAIESGLVKIPQLAVRDTTGAAIPGFRNIWKWILPQLTPAERGGRRGSPKPEAILKYAHTPIAMLGSLWAEEVRSWAAQTPDGRPPVFILVCKNTAIAKTVYEWLANASCPEGIPPVGIEEFRNSEERINTIRVDSKVVHETDTDGGKSDETKWMRFTLDTIGRQAWPADSQGRPLYPAGFDEVAKKLQRPLDPPGRDVRCIVSVGMLTEGWDANTVTHIVGLRPFMSQLLCEQVVGRGLRRVSYEVNADDRFSEEIATVFGVPFEVVPFKATQGTPPPPVNRVRVHAIPERAAYEIRFPRVEGFTQAIRNRVTVDWENVPSLTLDPSKIPPEVEVAGLNVTNAGRPTLLGPGRVNEVTLEKYRAGRRVQELVFDLARGLTVKYVEQKHTSVPAHALFPQLVRIVQQYIDEKVKVLPPAAVTDLFLSPYYGWLVERLSEAIRPDTSAGEAPEVPRYESTRGPGSTTDVDYWTSKDVRPTLKSHVNLMVADTLKWEQQAAQRLDTHTGVAAWVKNAGLGFAIPYMHDGQMHDYVPDFIVRLNDARAGHLILETKGFDPLREVKEAAAQRWLEAVNADGKFGTWKYAVAGSVADVGYILEAGPA